ncbi:hypothetical protein [Pseudomonas mosselii]|uniref:hypothetical protein n=1 Tax=Pseudomonas mosselii TaxID=78327 RepID=UPI000784C742|nr:hypothetical protein [Pseudomonas mosselii]MEA3234665.1 hypothetical protein [Pseudomonas mosselii]UWS65794.1 hypothetical protein N0U38_18680 [Pseudomonas mosselii]
MGQSENNPGVKCAETLVLIKLRTNAPEKILVVTGDDVASLEYGAEQRDDRLRLDGKGVRKALSD